MTPEEQIIDAILTQVERLREELGDLLKDVSLDFGNAQNISEEAQNNRNKVLSLFNQINDLLKTIPQQHTTVMVTNEDALKWNIDDLKANLEQSKTIPLSNNPTPPPANDYVELFRLKGTLSSVEATLNGLNSKVLEYQEEAKKLRNQINVLAQKIANEHQDS